MDKDPSSLNEVIGVVRSEESHRSIMLEPQTEGSVMKIEGTRMTDIEHKPFAGANNWDGGKSGNKDCVVCTSCKKPRHTKEKYWKLHGKPTNYQNSNSKNWSNRGSVNKGHSQAHVSSSQKCDVAEEFFAKGKLNTDEIEKLKSFLEILKNTPNQATCSIAFSGTTSSHPKLST